MTLPTFIVIGEQKCGTGWIRDRLREHPAVFMAPKELNFFNREAELARGIGHYARHFAGANAPIVGEKSPEYFWQRSGAPGYVQDIFGAIGQALPEVRLILVLRSPVDRAISALLHHARHRGRRIDPRILRDHAVSEILLSGRFDLARLGILERGFYHDRVEEALLRFGDRLQILFFEEDVVADPQSGLRKICRHIGAPDFEGFRYRQNEKVEKPSYLAMQISYNFEFLRPLIRRLDGGEPFRPRVTEDCRTALWEHYANDIDRLERLLNRKTPFRRPE